MRSDPIVLTEEKFLERLAACVNGDHVMISWGGRYYVAAIVQMEDGVYRVEGKSASGSAGPGDPWVNPSEIDEHDIQEVDIIGLKQDGQIYDREPEAEAL